MERTVAEPCKNVSNARARVVLPEQDGPATGMRAGGCPQLWNQVAMVSQSSAFGTSLARSQPLRAMPMP